MCRKGNLPWSPSRLRQRNRQSGLFNPRAGVTISTRRPSCGGIVIFSSSRRSLMVRVRVVMLLAAALLGVGSLPAWAAFQGLRISTPFPSQSARLGESLSLTLTVKNFGLPPQTVTLRVPTLPRGWKATFLGAGRVVESVFVDPDQDSSVTLRLEPPKGTKASEYDVQIVASGQSASATLSLKLTLGSVLPRRLSLDAELPVLRGAPTSSFREFRVQRQSTRQDAAQGDRKSTRLNSVTSLSRMPSSA